MKKVLIILAVGVGMAMALQSIANASLIIDTGVPQDTTGWAVMDKYGQYEALASEFSITAPGYVITDIEGYFYSVYAGNIHVEIAGDGGENPSSSIFYSGSTYVNSRNWFGVHSISGLVLEPGTYWVAFKPFSGTLVAMPTNAPNPLGNEAYYYYDSQHAAQWYEGDSLNLGVRISGERVVPEPATISLLGLGLAGLLRLRRKKIWN